MLLTGTVGLARRCPPAWRRAAKAQNGEIMAVASTETSSRPPSEGTVAQVMRPVLTTVEPNDHVAAAAYLMKHVGLSALVIVDADSGRLTGIITDTDIVHTVAGGKDINDVRIFEVMTPDPAVIDATTGIRQAAVLMTAGHFRHLPVVDDSDLVGIVDITAVCRALVD
jgi:CBS domain-containing protein